MPSVYVETTIPSYLVARPSRDLITAGRQQATRDWWARAAQRFDLVASETVIREIAAGDPREARKRLHVIRSLRVLDFTRAVRRLVRRYGRELALPRDARVDVMHIAFAVAHEIDYLLTWNCAHIANDVVIRRLVLFNDRNRLWIPRIVTPEVLLQEE